MEGAVDEIEEDAAPAFAAAREICKRHAKSFYFASLFLPKAKRNAAYSVYSFCRMLDVAIDVADGAQNISLEARLADFENQLNAIYAHRLDFPPSRERSTAQHALWAFSRTVQRYEIPQQHFRDLAQGCRMDLTVHRYATWGDLEKYCYHVAGVVGLVMSSIFGLQQEEARQQAVAMGNAMQLTNILRDVKVDWRRGRIYLPQEDMARFGYSTDDLSRGLCNDAFRRLMKFEIARARQQYRQASKGLCWLADDGSRLTASAMAVIYSGILDVIERKNYDVFKSRAHLTIGQKIRRLPAARRLAKREDGQPVPTVF